MYNLNNRVRGVSPHALALCVAVLYAKGHGFGFVCKHIEPGNNVVICLGPSYQEHHQIRIDNEGIVSGDEDIINGIREEVGILEGKLEKSK